MAADEALRAAAYGIEARTAAAVCDEERHATARFQS
jgi:hypothetical protein